MLLYTNPTFIKDNGNGYSLYEREVYCIECQKLIGVQKKYVGIDTEFNFSENKDWKFCPFCGSKFNNKI